MRKVLEALLGDGPLGAHAVPASGALDSWSYAQLMPVRREQLLGGLQSPWLSGGTAIEPVRKRNLRSGSAARAESNGVLASV